MRVEVGEVVGAPGPVAALGRLAGLGPCALLDSAGGAPARWSLLAFDPREELAGCRSLEEVARHARAFRVEAPAGMPGPFAGGFVGALAYDLGVAGEALALPREPWGQPLVAGGLYADWIAWDHARGTAWLATAARGGESAGARAERVRALLAAEPTPEPPPEPPPEPLGPLVRWTPPLEHRARVERCREWIAAGECYQANLAHRTTRALAGSPRALYAALRAAHPAPYAGFVEWEGGALLSASPELLLEVAGGEARTRPIKGTAPRGATPAEDAERARALLASEKDRAELAMIVDLERNDLGRVAEWGSVRVDRFPELESYASVHHLVATVRARPRAGVDAWDVLAALFPGGSVTGAPKLRAMEAIAELEGEGRGFYTGALGFCDVRGRAAWNVLIRSLAWRARADLGGAAGEASLRVGGGITWASDPDAEERETGHKAERLLAALGPELAEARGR